MTLSLLFTIKDSVSKMFKQIVLPLRYEGSRVSHIAAHGVGDIFQKLREDIIRDEFGSPSDSPVDRFLAWENDLPNKLKNGSDSTRCLAALMLGKLREDVSKAGFTLPPSQASSSLMYNHEDADTKLPISDIDRLCRETSVSRPLPS